MQGNCPFHRLAQRSPALVCDINRQFVRGILDGIQAPRLDAVLDPAQGRCCIVVHPT